MSCRICGVEKRESIHYGFCTELTIGKEDYGEHKGRLFFAAVGDSETSHYYPNYCPECGKKLNDEIE